MEVNLKKSHIIFIKPLKKFDEIEENSDEDGENNHDDSSFTHT